MQISGIKCWIKSSSALFVSSLFNNDFLKTDDKFCKAEIAWSWWFHGEVSCWLTWVNATVSNIPVASPNNLVSACRKLVVDNMSDDSHHQGMKTHIATWLSLVWVFTRQLQGTSSALVSSPCSQGSCWCSGARTTRPCHAAICPNWFPSHPSTLTCASAIFPCFRQMYTRRLLDSGLSITSWKLSEKIKLQSVHVSNNWN